MKISNIFTSTLFSALLVSAVFTGCSSDNSSSSDDSSTAVREAEVVTHTPETLHKEIKELEEAVANLDTPNHDKVTMQLIEYYQSYADLFSNNEKAPDMLFKAGNQAVNLQDYTLSLSLYNNVEIHYRNYMKRPECLFLQGFVYESYLNEFGKAKEKYEKLIKQYPKHELAGQAKESIKYLGISDEERIRQFENQ